MKRRRTGTIRRRYGHGPGVDVAFNDIDVAGASRRTLVPDIQGSIVGWLKSGGTLTTAGYRPWPSGSNWRREGGVADDFGDWFGFV